MRLHGARGATQAMAYNGTRLGLVAAVTGLLLAGCGGSGGGSAEATTTTESRERARREGGPEAAARLLPHGVPRPRRDPEAAAGRADADGDEQARRDGVVRVEGARASSASRKRKPEIARRMHTNLFPDSFEVVPRSRLDVYPIILDFATGCRRRERAREHACGRA